MCFICRITKSSQPQALSYNHTPLVTTIWRREPISRARTTGPDLAASSAHGPWAVAGKDKSATAMPSSFPLKAKRKNALFFGTEGAHLRYLSMNKTLFRSFQSHPNLVTDIPACATHPPHQSTLCNLRSARYS